LVIDGNRINDVDSWANNGYLAAYGNNGYIIRDYDVSNPGKTTVTACDISGGDYIQDCKVDLSDYAVLASLWQGDLPHLQILANNWLIDKQKNYPAGLIVNPVGTLQNKGKSFTGYTVNFFDAFYRTLLSGSSPPYDEKLAILADYDIPLARIAGCGFWAIDNVLYVNNKAEYFRRFDAVIASAEQHGVGLIPSLFWAYFTVPDIVGEPCNRWGDPGSQTIAYMRAYVQDVVTRYKDSPAIWGWECGNEWNLAADLPNAADHRPPIWPSLGTPAFRSAEDDMTHEMIVYALSEIAKEIRKYDPDRMISSGNTEPRPSAWHQWQYLSWEIDTPAQHAEMIARENPDPINTVGVHYYDASYDINFAVSVSETLRKPLFVGEFGVAEDPEKTPQQVEQEFNTMLNTLISENVPLSAIWVYERISEDGIWNVTSTNSRSYQLDALSQANQ